MPQNTGEIGTLHAYLYRKFKPPLELSNLQARHIAIACSGLDNAPASSCDKKKLIKLIKQLGYVQQDPLKVVARAHDHILWSRNNNYRPEKLNELLEKDRLIFEHFCHDACVLPMDTLPYWKHQFHRKSKLFASKNSRNKLLNSKERKSLLSRIANEGPLSSKDFNVPGKLKAAAWSKPAHKQTLDFLWLTGVLAVSKRENFIKYYDLAERVYPKRLAESQQSDVERLTWLSTHALKSLGFGTASEIMRFWEASSLAETKTWFEKNKTKNRMVSVESWTGEYSEAMTLATPKSIIHSPPPLSKRLRIINPFDPLVRDRKRLERLFGFNYRIEIYVPPEKRKFGYYVYPLLEYDKFVGRLEVRHDRERNCIAVHNLWNEPNTKFGKQRMGKLHSELEMLKRFCNADHVEWSQ